jgi:hypothetical protein
MRMVTKLEAKKPKGTLLPLLILIIKVR